MAKAYLCMISKISNENPTPKFAGYRIFSEPPWDLTQIPGLVHTTLYESKGEDFNEAIHSMERAVQYMSMNGNNPFWSNVWKWIDPSREAAFKRFDLIEALEP